VTPVWGWVSIVIGYLLGSISFSFLAGKWLKGIDIRQHGSGNAGATNTLRVLGKGPGIAVLLLDMLKGIAAVWIGYALGGGDPLVQVLAGMSVIVGHNWPVFSASAAAKELQRRSALWQRLRSCRRCTPALPR